MRIKENANIASFLLTVQKSKGDVLFKTSEGDIMNLKSTLSAYVFTAAAIHPQILSSGEVECANPEDERILGEYLTE